MYNLIPRASCLSDIGRQGLSITGHLNINSICNKFEMLSMSVAQYVDILMLSETKLDSTFPSIQFLINGFSVPHRLDRNSKGGGILLYVRDKIIVLSLNRYSLPPHINILFMKYITSNVGGNNSTDDLSEPDDEMETGSINDNFRNAFYFAARINLHTFLAEQVTSVL